VGIGLAIWGISYGRRQFELSKQQDEAAKKQAKEDAEWWEQFGKATKSITTIGKNYLSMPQGFGFDIVFADNDLRQRIGAYFINLSPNRDMQVRSLAPEQLRLPDVRRTISNVNSAVESAKKEPRV
jgi:hypothetical protein